MVTTLYCIQIKTLPAFIQAGFDHRLLIRPPDVLAGADALTGYRWQRNRHVAEVDLDVREDDLVDHEALRLAGLLGFWFGLGLGLGLLRLAVVAQPVEEAALVVLLLRGLFALDVREDLAEVRSRDRGGYDKPVKNNFLRNPEAYSKKNVTGFKTASDIFPKCFRRPSSRCTG